MLEQSRKTSTPAKLKSSAGLSPQAALILAHSAQLSDKLDTLKFPKDVFVYNPLRYAWKPYAEYVSRYARRPLRGLFLGMNPGPFGMMQTGIPFGEISLVKNFLKISTGVEAPIKQHPKRPILGFDCPRSEVSGLRLWSLFEDKFKSADVFFNDFFVLNYCPLGFLSPTGANLTPDKIPLKQRQQIEKLCDEHLAKVIEVLAPEVLVGVGAYASKNFERVSPGSKIVTLLHPSPASPAANKGWAEIATKQLKDYKLF